MSIKELAKLVRNMRAKQKEYFRTRQLSVIEQSKRLEKQVDAAVAEILEPPTLFDVGKPKPKERPAAVSREPQTYGRDSLGRLNTPVAIWFRMFKSFHHADYVMTTQDNSVLGALHAQYPLARIQDLKARYGAYLLDQGQTRMGWSLFRFEREQNKYVGATPCEREEPNAAATAAAPTEEAAPGAIESDTDDEAFWAPNTNTTGKSPATQ